MGREIVIPGEELCSGKNLKAGFGAYKSGNKIYSSIYGITDRNREFLRVVPLGGKYIPIRGDYIIGIVEDIKFNRCVVDINSPYTAFLSMFRENEFKRSDIILAKIQNVDEVNNVMLSDAKRLYDGKLIEVASVKIPRIFGKKGSMLDILKKEGNCMIFLGRNGRIFIKGERQNIIKVEKALRMIEEQAHTYGLTDRIKSFLSDTNEGESKVNQ